MAFKTGLFVFLFALACLVQAKEIIKPPGGATRGDRGSWKYCRTGYYVDAMRALYEKDKLVRDDTGLNKIEFRCCPCATGSASDCYTVTTPGHNWGSWKGWQYCDNGGFVNSINMRTEFGRGTGLNAIGFKCLAENGDETIKKTNSGEHGSWRSYASCSNDYYMMGMKLFYQRSMGKWKDDTGGNKVEFSCSGACCGDGVLTDEELSEAAASTYCDGETDSSDPEQNEWNRVGCVNCKIQEGYQCTTVTSTAASHSGSATSHCKPICGDSITVASERTFGRCEDHNTRNGDGCDSNCFVEPGWICTQKFNSGFEYSDCKDATEGYLCDDSVWREDGTNNCYSSANPFNVCGAHATVTNLDYPSSGNAFSCTCATGAEFATETRDTRITIKPISGSSGSGSFGRYNDLDLAVNAATPYILIYGSGENNVSLSSWGCNDIDECASASVSKCEMGAFGDYAGYEDIEPVLCQNIIDSSRVPQFGYQCSCAPGFGYLNPGATHTQDVIENISCEDGDCSMNSGVITRYNPEGMGFRCWDINRCAHPEVYGDVCPATALCRNILSSSGEQCECPAGYRPVYNDDDMLTGCEDIDECAIADYCGEDTICENLDGSVMCRCKDGYEISTAGTCSPVNPCEDGSVQVLCGSIDATCEYTGPGTYLCVTNERRRRNLRRRESGREGFNLCETDTGCGDHADCEYLAAEGYHVCTCQPGHVGNPYTGCEQREVDYSASCNRGHGGCGIHAQCQTDAAGSMSCVCDEGYVEESGECVLDPTPVPCPANADCARLESGQIAVVCQEGYVVRGYEFAQANVSAIYANAENRQCRIPNPCEWGNGGCGNNMDCTYNEDLEEPQVECECSDGYYNDTTECIPVYDAEEVKQYMEEPCQAECNALLLEYYEELEMVQKDITDSNCTGQCVEHFSIYSEEAIVLIYVRNKTESYPFVLNPDFSDAEAALMPEYVSYYDCDVYGYVEPTAAEFAIGFESCGVNLDECAYAEANDLSICGPNANCVDTVGSFYCECKLGTTGNGNGHCVDIDECRYGCGPHGVCRNTVDLELSVQDSLATACRCDPGFRLDPNTLMCEDVNECVLNGACNVNAKCTNTEGSHTCECKEGFYGNGIYCYDINECIETPEVCPENSDCVNKAGAYECYCNDGFEMLTINGITGCYQSKTCDESKCDEGFQCLEYGGGYTCLCPDDYYRTPADTCAPCPASCADAADTHIARCDRHTGRCLACPPFRTGPACDRCSDGYYGNLTAGEECRPCDCNLHSATCNPLTGECACLDNTDGFHCENCKEGFFGDARNGSLPADGVGCTIRCNPACEHGSCTEEELDMCICADGWKGVNCDEDIDECEEDPSICVGSPSGTACVNVPGSYHCMQKADQCLTYLSCDSCNAQPGCGWCSEYYGVAAHCVAGSEWGFNPTFVCTQAYYSPDTCLDIAPAGVVDAMAVDENGNEVTNIDELTGRVSLTATVSVTGCEDGVDELESLYFYSYVYDPSTGTYALPLASTSANVVLLEDSSVEGEGVITGVSCRSLTEFSLVYDMSGMVYPAHVMKVDTRNQYDECRTTNNALQFELVSSAMRVVAVQSTYLKGEIVPLDMSANEEDVYDVFNALILNHFFIKGIQFYNGFTEEPLDRQLLNQTSATENGYIWSDETRHITIVKEFNCNNPVKGNTIVAVPILVNNESPAHLYSELPVATACISNHWMWHKFNALDSADPRGDVYGIDISSFIAAIPIVGIEGVDVGLDFQFGPFSITFVIGPNTYDTGIGALSMYNLISIAVSLPVADVAATGEISASGGLEYYAGRDTWEALIKELTFTLSLEVEIPVYGISLSHSKGGDDDDKVTDADRVKKITTGDGPDAPNHGGNQGGDGGGDVGGNGAAVGPNDVAVGNEMAGAVNREGGMISAAIDYIKKDFKGVKHAMSLNSVFSIEMKYGFSRKTITTETAADGTKTKTTTTKKAVGRNRVETVKTFKADGTLVNTKKTTVTKESSTKSKYVVEEGSGAPRTYFVESSKTKDGEKLTTTEGGVITKVEEFSHNRETGGKTRTITEHNVSPMKKTVCNYQPKRFFSSSSSSTTEVFSGDTLTSRVTVENTKKSTRQFTETFEGGNVVHSEDIMTDTKKNALTRKIVEADPDRSVTYTTSTIKDSITKKRVLEYSCSYEAGHNPDNRPSSVTRYALDGEHWSCTYSQIQYTDGTTVTRPDNTDDHIITESGGTTQEVVIDADSGETTTTINDGEKRMVKVQDTATPDTVKRLEISANDNSYSYTQTVEGAETTTVLVRHNEGVEETVTHISTGVEGQDSIVFKSGTGAERTYLQNDRNEFVCVQSSENGVTYIGDVMRQTYAIEKLVDGGISYSQTQSVNAEGVISVEKVMSMVHNDGSMITCTRKNALEDANDYTVVSVTRSPDNAVLQTTTWTIHIDPQTGGRTEKFENSNNDAEPSHLWAFHHFEADMNFNDNLNLDKPGEPASLDPPANDALVEVTISRDGNTVGIRKGELAQTKTVNSETKESTVTITNGNENTVRITTHAGIESYLGFSADGVDYSKTIADGTVTEVLATHDDESATTVTSVDGAIKKVEYENGDIARTYEPNADGEMVVTSANEIGRTYVASPDRASYEIRITQDNFVYTESKAIDGTLKKVAKETREDGTTVTCTTENPNQNPSTVTSITVDGEGNPIAETEYKVASGGVSFVPGSGEVSELIDFHEFSDEDLTFEDAPPVEPITDYNVQDEIILEVPAEEHGIYELENGLTGSFDTASYYNVDNEDHQIREAKSLALKFLSYLKYFLNQGAKTNRVRSSLPDSDSVFIGNCTDIESIAGNLSYENCKTCYKDGSDVFCHSCLDGWHMPENTDVNFCTEPCGCGAGEWERRECTSYRASDCAKCSACERNQYQRVDCTDYNDRICEECTVCGEDEEEVEPCSSTADTVCQPVYGTRAYALQVMHQKRGALTSFAKWLKKAGLNIEFQVYLKLAFKLIIPYVWDEEAKKLDFDGMYMGIGFGVGMDLSVSIGCASFSLNAEGQITLYFPIKADYRTTLQLDVSISFKLKIVFVSFSKTVFSKNFRWALNEGTDPPVRREQLLVTQNIHQHLPNQHQMKSALVDLYTQGPEQAGLSIGYINSPEMQRTPVKQLFMQNKARRGEPSATSSTLILPDDVLLVKNVLSEAEPVFSNVLVGKNPNNYVSQIMAMTYQESCTGNSICLAVYYSRMLASSEEWEPMKPLTGALPDNIVELDPKMEPLLNGSVAIVWLRSYLSSVGSATVNSGAAGAETANTTIMYAVLDTQSATNSLTPPLEIPYRSSIVSHELSVLGNLPVVAFVSDEDEELLTFHDRKLFISFFSNETSAFASPIEIHEGFLGGLVSVAGVDDKAVVAWNYIYPEQSFSYVLFAIVSQDGSVKGPYRADGGVVPTADDIDDVFFASFYQSSPQLMGGRDDGRVLLTYTGPDSVRTRFISIESPSSFSLKTLQTIGNAYRVRAARVDDGWLVGVSTSAESESSIVSGNCTVANTTDSDAEEGTFSNSSMPLEKYFEVFKMAHTSLTFKGPLILDRPDDTSRYANRVLETAVGLSYLAESDEVLVYSTRTAISDPNGTPITSDIVYSIHCLAADFAWENVVFNATTSALSLRLVNKGAYTTTDFADVIVVGSDGLEEETLYHQSVGTMDAYDFVDIALDISAAEAQFPLFKAQVDKETLCDDCGVFSNTALLLNTNITITGVSLTPSAEDSSQGILTVSVATEKSLTLDDDYVEVKMYSRNPASGLFPEQQWQLITTKPCGFPGQASFAVSFEVNPSSFLSEAIKLELVPTMDSLYPLGNLDSAKYEGSIPVVADFRTSRSSLQIMSYPNGASYPARVEFDVDNRGIFEEEVLVEVYLTAVSSSTRDGSSLAVAQRITVPPQSPTTFSLCIPVPSADSYAATLKINKDLGVLETDFSMNEIQFTLQNKPVANVMVQSTGYFYSASKATLQLSVTNGGNAVAFDYTLYVFLSNPADSAATLLGLTTVPELAVEETALVEVKLLAGAMAKCSHEYVHVMTVKTEKEGAIYSNMDAILECNSFILNKTNAFLLLEKDSLHDQSAVCALAANQVPDIPSYSEVTVEYDVMEHLTLNVTDDSSISNLQFTITSVVVPGSGRLFSVQLADNSAVTLSSDNLPLVLPKGLQTVKYFASSPTSMGHLGQVSQLEYTVYDGMARSSKGLVVVRHDDDAYNYAPEFSGPSSIFCFEDSRGSLSGISISDMNGLFWPATLTVSVNDGVLSYRGSDFEDLTVLKESSSKYVFEGSFTLINKAIQYLAYVPRENVNSVNTQYDILVSMTVEDYYLQPKQTVSQSWRVDIMAVNDPPTIIAPATHLFYEDTAGLVTEIDFFDVDEAEVADSSVILYSFAATVSVGNLSVYEHVSSAAESVINTLPMGTPTLFYPNLPDIFDTENESNSTLYGSGFPAEIRAALKSLAYLPPPDLNSISVPNFPVITLYLCDGSNVGTGGTYCVTAEIEAIVVPVLDPLLLSLERNALEVVSGTENGLNTLGLVVTNKEAISDNGNVDVTLLLTLSAVRGRFAYTGENGFLSENADSLTLVGSALALNSLFFNASSAPVYVAPVNYDEDSVFVEVAYNSSVGIWSAEGDAAVIDISITSSFPNPSLSIPIKNVVTYENQAVLLSPVHVSLGTEFLWAHQQTGSEMCLFYATQVGVFTHLAVQTNDLTTGIPFEVQGNLTSALTLCAHSTRHLSEAARSILFTPGANTYGDNAISLFLSCSATQNASDVMTVTVEPVNTAPSFSVCESVAVTALDNTTLEYPRVAFLDSCLSIDDVESSRNKSHLFMHIYASDGGFLWKENLNPNVSSRTQKEEVVGMSEATVYSDYSTYFWLNWHLSSSLQVLSSSDYCPRCEDNYHYSYDSEVKSILDVPLQQVADILAYLPQGTQLTSAELSLDVVKAHLPCKNTTLELLQIEIPYIWRNHYHFFKRGNMMNRRSMGYDFWRSWNKALEEAVVVDVMDVDESLGSHDILSFDILSSLLTGPSHSENEFAWVLQLKTTDLCVSNSRRHPSSYYNHFKYHEEIDSYIGFFPRGNSHSPSIEINLDVPILAYAAPLNTVSFWGTPATIGGKISELIFIPKNTSYGIGTIAFELTDPALVDYSTSPQSVVLTQYLPVQLGEMRNSANVFPPLHPVTNNYVIPVEEETLTPLGSIGLDLAIPDPNATVQIRLFSEYERAMISNISSHSLVFAADADDSTDDTGENDDLSFNGNSGFKTALVYYNQDHFSGKTVVRAKLYFYVKKWTGYSNSVDLLLYRMTESWTEGCVTSHCLHCTGNDSQPWYEFNCTTETDFSAVSEAAPYELEPSERLTIYRSQTGSWVSVDVTTDAAAFASGLLANHGWAVRVPYNHGSVRLASRESAFAPYLKLETVEDTPVLTTTARYFNHTLRELVGTLPSTTSANNVSVLVSVANAQDLRVDLTLTPISIPSSNPVHSFSGPATVRAGEEAEFTVTPQWSMYSVRDVTFVAVGHGKQEADVVVSTTGSGYYGSKQYNFSMRFPVAGVYRIYPVLSHTVLPNSPLIIEVVAAAPQTLSLEGTVALQDFYPVTAGEPFILEAYLYDAFDNLAPCDNVQIEDSLFPDTSFVLTSGENTTLTPCVISVTAFTSGDHAVLAHVNNQTSSIFAFTVVPASLSLTHSSGVVSEYSVTGETVTVEYSLNDPFGNALSPFSVMSNVSLTVVYSSVSSRPTVPSQMKMPLSAESSNVFTFVPYWAGSYEVQLWFGGSMLMGTTISIEASSPSSEWSSLALLQATSSVGSNLTAVITLADAWGNFVPFSHLDYEDLVGSITTTPSDSVFVSAGVAIGEAEVKWAPERKGVSCLNVEIADTLFSECAMITPGMFAVEATTTEVVLNPYVVEQSLNMEGHITVPGGILFAFEITPRDAYGNYVDGELYGTMVTLTGPSQVCCDTEAIEGGRWLALCVAYTTGTYSVATEVNKVQIATPLLVEVVDATETIGLFEYVYSDGVVSGPSLDCSCGIDLPISVGGASFDTVVAGTFSTLTFTPLNRYNNQLTYPQENNITAWVVEAEEDRLEMSVALNEDGSITLTLPAPGLTIAGTSLLYVQDSLESWPSYIPLTVVPAAIAPNSSAISLDDGYTWKEQMAYLVYFFPEDQYGNPTSTVGSLAIKVTTVGSTAALSTGTLLAVESYIDAVVVSFKVNAIWPGDFSLRVLSDGVQMAVLTHAAQPMVNDELVFMATEDELFGLSGFPCHPATQLVLTSVLYRATNTSISVVDTENVATHLDIPFSALRLDLNSFSFRFTDNSYGQEYAIFTYICTKDNYNSTAGLISLSISPVNDAPSLSLSIEPSIFTYGNMSISNIGSVNDIDDPVLSVSLSLTHSQSRVSLEALNTKALYVPVAEPLEDTRSVTVREMYSRNYWDFHTHNYTTTPEDHHYGDGYGHRTYPASMVRMGGRFAARLTIDTARIYNLAMAPRPFDRKLTRAVLSARIGFHYFHSWQYYWGARLVLCPVACDADGDCAVDLATAAFSARMLYTVPKHALHRYVEFDLTNYLQTTLSANSTTEDWALVFADYAHKEIISFPVAAHMHNDDEPAVILEYSTYNPFETEGNSLSFQASIEDVNTALSLVHVSLDESCSNDTLSIVVTDAGELSSHGEVLIVKEETDSGSSAEEDDTPAAGWWVGSAVVVSVGGASIAAAHLLQKRKILSQAKHLAKSTPTVDVGHCELQVVEQSSSIGNDAVPLDGEPSV